MTTPNALLIEKLVRLCDEYPTVPPLPAYDLVYDLMAMYRKDIPWPPTGTGYRDLLILAQDYIWAHYRTQITADMLEELLEEMDEAEENANE